MPNPASIYPPASSVMTSELNAFPWPILTVSVVVVVVVVVVAYPNIPFLESGKNLLPSFAPVKSSVFRNLGARVSEV